MRFLFVIYDVAYDEDIMAIISGCSVTGFTKWEKVLGKGPNSEPKMDTAVWPGFNCAVGVGVTEGVEGSLLAELKRFMDQVGGKGIKVFELPVRQVLG